MSSPPPSFLCHHSHGRLGDGVAFPTGVRPAGGATGLVRVQGSRAGLAHGAAWRRSAQGSPAMGAHRRRDKRGSVLAVVAPETGPALAQGGECAGLGPEKAGGPSSRNSSHIYICMLRSRPSGSAEGPVAQAWQEPVFRPHPPSTRCLGSEPSRDAFTSAVSPAARRHRLASRTGGTALQVVSNPASAGRWLGASLAQAACRLPPPPDCRVPRPRPPRLRKATAERSTDQIE